VTEDEKIRRGCVRFTALRESIGHERATSMALEMRTVVARHGFDPTPRNVLLAAGSVPEEEWATACSRIPETN
jgi:hypothetical protein